MTSSSATDLMKKLLPIFLLFVSSIAIGQIEKYIPSAPSPPRLVNQLGKNKILTAEQEAELELKLKRYDDSTSSQITIVVVDQLDGYSANEYAVALGRKWGVGGKQFSNGVVILIANGSSPGDRDAYIATGYGLEGAIPDITAKQIVDNDLIPNFKEGNYYRGLDEATNNLFKAAAGEYQAPKGYGNRNKKGLNPTTIAFGIIMLLLFIFGGIGGSGGGGFMSRRGYTGWGGWTGGGGGWSGGGGGGGGFGGFGGGSFGGGGAGGKW